MAGCTAFISLGAHPTSLWPVPAVGSRPRLEPLRSEVREVTAVQSSCPAVLAAVAAVCVARRKDRSRPLALRATTVEAESITGLAPWEIEEETEDERQARYAREADEMKLKWDARRLEEKQSAQRRQAWAQKEQERASLYGPRDPIMEAYEARIYEEARVIEVRRRQREVYERIKAHKEGKALPPKGTPYVTLKASPTEPVKPEEFDISGHYKPEEDLEAKKYKAPESYVSPSGSAPPPRHKRGAPRAAWEAQQYAPPRPNAPPPKEWPEPGSLPADTVPPVRAKIEEERANRKSRRQRMMEEQERLDRGESPAVEEEEDLEDEDLESLLGTILCMITTRSVFAIPYIHVNIFQHIGLPMYDVKKRPRRLYQLASAALNLPRNPLLDYSFGHSIISCHVEHHLFPRLSDNMCLKIKPVVSSYLKNNSLPYNEANYMNQLSKFYNNYDELMVKAPPITELIGIQ